MLLLQKLSMKTLMAFLVLVSASALVACGESAPGEDAFDAANDQIDKYDEEVGFGSTDATKAVAVAFAKRAKVIDDENFSGGGAQMLDSTDGMFMAYTHIKNDTAVFLLHVPKFKQYEGDVRAGLIDLMWGAAAQSIRNAKLTDVKNVIVALRGRALYGGLASGKVSGSTPESKEQGTVVSQEGLYAYFIDETAAAETEAEAAPAE